MKALEDFLLGIGGIAVLALFTGLPRRLPSAAAPMHSFSATYPTTW